MLFYLCLLCWVKSNSAPVLKDTDANLSSFLLLCLWPRKDLFSGGALQCMCRLGWWRVFLHFRKKNCQSLTSPWLKRSLGHLGFWRGTNSWSFPDDVAIFYHATARQRTWCTACDSLHKKSSSSCTSSAWTNPLRFLVIRFDSSCSSSGVDYDMAPFFRSDTLSSTLSETDALHTSSSISEIHVL